jgi:selenocysteine-specific elongation factor
MPREELRNRTGLKNAIFNMLLDNESKIVSQNNMVRLADHQIEFNAAQQAKVQQLMDMMKNAPYTPPSYTEAVAIVGDDVLHALIDLGDIVQVQPDVIFAAAAYQEMVEAVLQIIDEKGSIAANELRDRFTTTRKYAIGLLEYLDSIGVTRRSGDVRVRGSRAV